MCTECMITSSGATLAKSVRGLALESHRVLREARVRGGPEASEVYSLLEQIEQLRKSLRGSRQAELRGWLDSLAARLEESRETEVTPALSYR